MDKKEYNKEWYVKNKERILARAKFLRTTNPEKNKAKCKKSRDKAFAKDKNYHRRRFYKQRFGLSLEQVEEIKSRGCTVCGTKESLHIDHCHETGTIRGCLCQKHNQALGLVGESAAITIKLYNYIINVCQPIKEKLNG